MRRIGAIVQARMGSSRYPGKTLAMVGSAPLLEILLQRLNMSRMLGDVIVATTTHPRDDCIVQLCQEAGINCFRGDEENVLSRYIRAAQKFDIDEVVRVTGDNPLTDIELMDELITLHIEEKADYSHCIGFPLGTATEVVGRNVLESYNSTELEKRYKEHVTLFIPDHPGLFKVSSIINKNQTLWQGIRLTVDTVQDIELIRYLSDNMADLTRINTREVIDYLLTHPAVVQINRNVVQKNPGSD